MHIRWVLPIVICDDEPETLYVAFYNSGRSAIIDMYMVPPIAICDRPDLILIMS